ncbi:hypothetical protein AB0B89_27955 [Sphaerisporangium sp. NPDC049002]
MLPVVYDPTIAEAIRSYSHEYRRPRGVYLLLRPGERSVAVHQGQLP